MSYLVYLVDVYKLCIKILPIDYCLIILFKSKNIPVRKLSPFKLQRISLIYYTYGKYFSCPFLAISSISFSSSCSIPTTTETPASILTGIFPLLTFAHAILNMRVHDYRGLKQLLLSLDLPSHVYV